MDVDTRLLRYFAAVAEEGNLTRAAARLHVSQPALTKQIRRLETLIGARLFSRSRSGMSLTEAGRSLARSAPALLAEWRRTVAETKAAAARESRVLRVGFLASAANELTQQIIADFGGRRPGWRVDMRQGSWSDPTAGLGAGTVDVALLRLPFPGEESWRVEVLLTEPRCVVLPSTHHFAARTEVAFHELRDEPFVAAPNATGLWRDYWLAVEERNGAPPRIGAATEHPDDWLNAIANGYGIGLAPESSARYYRRPGVAFVPVTGISPSRVGIVWDPADDDNPIVRDFVRSCLSFTQP